jgi:hypothetical protein
MKKVYAILTFSILTVIVNAQTKQKPFGSWSAELGYLISTNNTNTKNTKPLFASNGINAALNYRWGKTLGIKTSLGFNGGKTNDKEILSFAKTFGGNGFTAISSFSKSWNQMNLLVGPSVLLGKRGRLELNLQGGMGYMLSANNLKIDLYDATTFAKNVFNVESKSITPMWNIGGSYYLNKLSKNVAMKINAGFGSNGGTIGIALMDTRGCMLCLCCRFCPMGCPTTPTKGNK